MVQGAGFRVQGSGFRVQGSGFRFQGSGFRVQGFRGLGHLRRVVSVVQGGIELAYHGAAGARQGGH